jgi:mannose-6-phosphate isomerase-like protein (cupin superfamily)
MGQSTDTLALRNVVSPPGTGRTENVFGIKHTYLLEAQQTGGMMACIETLVSPGEGVPPHTHHLEDEIFYVAEGSAEIAGDDLVAPTIIPQGGLFYSPRGRLHTFRNPTDAPIRIIVFMTPGANMQRMFGELAALTSRSAGKPDPSEVTSLCARFDIAFAPPPLSQQRR